MDMIVQGFLSVLNIECFIAIFAGMFIGIVFGVIPGLNANIAIVLFFPLSLNLSPIPGILMLLAIFCGASYGGAIPAILIGTPGTNNAVATVLDGLPMAKKGQGKKALSMALVASTFGGLISGILLLFFAPLIGVLTLSFGPPEFFVIALFGLSAIASISGESFLKGLLAGCLGFILSLIGLDTMSGSSRFTFNNYQLFDGLGINPVLMGLFAIPVLLEKIIDIKSGNMNQLEIKDINFGEKLTKKEIIQCMPVLIRSTIIGNIIGAIPGVGAGVSSFLCYNDAKRTSKHPKDFGTGCLEGVAAPEAGNNAVTGSSLIPTLTLGVPGAPAAAVLMGAFIMHGLQPGPLLFKQHGLTMFAIMFGFIIGNIVMFIQGSLLIKGFINIIKVPLSILVPTMTVTCFAGVFAARNNMIAIYIMVVCGLLSYILSLFKVPIIPIVLGFILGPIAEYNMRRALVMSDGSYSIFFTRPICVFFLILTVVFVVMTKRNEHKREKTK
jgi:putative tricarboxylic transport membrane protein